MKYRTETIEVNALLGVERLTPVTFQNVTRDDIEVKVVDSGNVDAIRSVEVKSRIQGRVAKLYVNEGVFRYRNRDSVTGMIHTLAGPGRKK